MRFILIVALLVVLAAVAPGRASQCDALKPTPPGDTSVNFAGEVEGKLGGIIGRLTGGVAELKGDFQKTFKDTLPHYTNADKLFVWQRLLYLACINPNSKIKLNDLLQAYLVGPPSLFGGLGPAPKKRELEVVLVGVERRLKLTQHEKFQMEMHARHPGSFRKPAVYRRLVFEFRNNSAKDTITVGSGGADSCEFVGFRFPGQAPINMSVRIRNIGPLQQKIRPGETALIAFKLETHFRGELSYRARSRNYSQCTFQVLAGLGANLTYRIPSQPNYMSH